LIMEENCFPEQIFSVMKPVCTMIKITYWHIPQNYLWH
jgi:hypothetical protein